MYGQQVLVHDLADAIQPRAGPGAGGGANGGPVVVQRAPPARDTGTTCDDVAGEIFAPALTAEDEFVGAFRAREAWTLNLLRKTGTPQASEADARADMLEPRIVVAERNRARGGGRPDRAGRVCRAGWYFKFKRAPEPCTEEEFNRIVARLRKISSDHPKMAIAPGTIVWRRKHRKGHKGSQMANTASVVYDGELVTLIHKAAVNADLDGYPKRGQRQEEWNAFQRHEPRARSPRSTA
ncbi:MAG TPA: hypothetical protein VHX88_06505 [Solirubrobacteraceae bacterium]|nr:hypothetical protein [Solirubrobacteraceae bacterium]